MGKTLKSLRLEVRPIRAAGVEARLWDAVYGNPTDLESRAVLADALSSAGDPRGDFISAQLQGHREPPPSKLLPLLLGPLGDFLQPESVVFANGFPVRGALVKLSTPRQQVALQCREWATFEHIDGAVVGPAPRAPVSQRSAREGN